MIDIRFSVLIPCYNSEASIERAIRSVIDGTCPPHEVLVYDDASTDGTVALIKKICEENEGVRLIVGDSNQGAGFARSVLIEAMTGNYICFLDADDWWEKDKLKRQFDVIQETSCDIVTCGMVLIDGDGKRFGTRMPISKINRFTMHITDWLPNSVTAVRRSVTGADEMSLSRHRQDYAYWLNIFNKNAGLKCVVIQEFLGTYTRHNGGLSSRPMRNIYYNYRMFRVDLEYPIVVAILLTVCNGIVRIFRD